jgi:tRNA(fMet)-specific endonuclease VapC
VKFLLDTDIFSAIASRRNPGALERLRALPDGAAGVCWITLGEVAYGVRRSKPAPRTMSGIESLRRSLIKLPLDEPVVEQYARVRAALEAKGRPIGPNDSWIAAHALAHGLTLVTGNEREFRSVPGLTVENWLT